jgi:type IV pilus assembly protein PilX
MKSLFNPRGRLPQSPRRQSGIALVVALILLVVMTLLGLGAMRSVTLEEKMAANTFDRSVSFQAAEAALREAESLLDIPSPPTPAAGSACSGGMCGAPAVTGTPRWLDSAFTGWQSATAVASGPISVTPEYFIEYLGDSFPCQPNDLTGAVDCKRYRVTVRSNAGTDRAAVMLQSIYAAP